MTTREEMYEHDVERLVEAVIGWVGYYHKYDCTPKNDVQQRNLYEQRCKHWRLRAYRIGQYLYAVSDDTQRAKATATLEQRVAALEAQARNNQHDCKVLQINELKANVAMLEDVMDNYEAQCADDARRIAELEGVVNALMRQNEALKADAETKDATNQTRDSIIERLAEACIARNARLADDATRELVQNYYGIQPRG